MIRALLLTTLVAQAALADEVFFGFTLDSSAAVTVKTTRTETYPEGAEDGSDATTVEHSVWTVWDLRSGEKKEITDDTQFKAWLQKHKLAPVKFSRASPDGKARAEVTFDADVGAGTWTNEKWYSDANWTLAITRAGQTRAVEHCSGASFIMVSWSPDGKHTAWNIVHSYPTYYIRGTNVGGDETHVLIASEDSIALSVAAPTREAGKAAAAILKKASFDDAAISIALKKRDATVIYFAKEQRETAEKIVPLFPGSTIAPMDWVAPFDVVVALGAK